MRMSRDHILTSQAGSLPRPDDLIEANRAREIRRDDGRANIPGHAAARLSSTWCGGKRKSASTCPATASSASRWGTRSTIGAWWSYCFNRLGGLDLAGPGLYEFSPGAPNSRRDRAHQLCRPPRPQQISCRSTSDRSDDRAGNDELAGGRRSNHLQGTGGDQGRHRPLQGGAQSLRRRRRLHDLGRAGERGALCQ